MVLPFDTNQQHRISVVEHKQELKAYGYQIGRISALQRSTTQQQHNDYNPIESRLGYFFLYIFLYFSPLYFTAITVKKSIFIVRLPYIQQPLLYTFFKRFATTTTTSKVESVCVYV